MENVRNDVCCPEFTLDHIPETNGHIKNSADTKLDARRKSKSNSISSSRPDHSSTVKLVMREPTIKRKRSLWKSIVYWMLIIVLSVIVIVMSSLYVNELKKMTITEKEKQAPEECFQRQIPVSIKNVKENQIVKEAIAKSQRSIFQMFSMKDRNHYKALSVSVSYMGETIWKASYGGMNFTDENSSRVTCDTPYPIASVSKLITVLAIQMLYEKGIVKSLDDEVQKYDQRFDIINPFNKKQITIRQLACMMSGVPREGPCYPPVKDNLCPYNTSQMLKRINKIELIVPPNRRPHYSNLGISILGRLINSILPNETFESWVTKNIVKPLKMNNTGFSPISIEKQIPVTNLLNNQDGFAQIMDWGWLTPAGGMYSSVNDLGKLSSHLLGKMSKEGNILSEYGKRNMFRPEYIWSDRIAQGCPFEINHVDPELEKSKRIGYMTYSKNGNIFGYASMVSMVPDLKLALNMIVARPESNQVFIVGEIMKNFVKAIHQLLKTKREIYNLPKNPEYYTGTYMSSSSWPLITEPCVVSLENNMLFLKLQWFYAPLTFYRNTTLKTGNFGKNFMKPSRKCSRLGIGLLGEKFIFESSNKSKAPSFYMNGLASYGYVYFKRIS